MERPPASLDSRRPDVNVLLWAYRHGFFPMAEPGSGRVSWYCPHPRAIIPLDAFHVPKSLAREARRGRFEIRCDTAFTDVMRACAGPRRSDRLTWISAGLIEAYSELHRLGNAHSVEAWRGGHLVGGLYGVHVGAAFFGESMFVCPEAGGSNSSKVTLIWLVRHLRERGFTLLDTQFWNEHMEQFGCVEISRSEYLRRLAGAVARDVTWGPEGVAERVSS